MNKPKKSADECHWYVAKGKNHTGCGFFSDTAHRLVLNEFNANYCPYCGRKINKD